MSMMTLSAHSETLQEWRQRSAQATEQMSSFDAAVYSALKDNDVDNLWKVYKALDAESDAAEARAEQGLDATGCDVAVQHLPVAVGFILNKIDAARSFEDWMADEIELELASYANMIENCAGDAAVSFPPLRVTTKFVKSL